MSSVAESDQTSATKPPLRRLSCERCGTEFGCDLSSDCWCHTETARLPMPTSGGDCLCPDCLRTAAAAAKESPPAA
ncbi:MAG: cysteine-rich CWC family protein [Pseudomonadota bacterium]